MGSLTYQNGSPVIPIQDDFYQISVAPQVTLSDCGPSACVRVTQFLGAICDVRRPGHEQSYFEGDLGLTERRFEIDTSVTGEADLVISNSPPEIVSVVTSTNGVPVYSVAPGTTVQVSVNVNFSGLGVFSLYAWFDEDDNPLPYPSSSNIS